MTERFSRMEMLIGGEAMERLAASRVAVFGIGGVGGHAAEALVRSGVGALDLIDDDRVCPSNINRQIFATEATVGMYKTDAALRRLSEISPTAKITAHRVFYTRETESLFDFSDYDYIIDAIDTVSGKIAIVQNAAAANTPVISAMGAGNKLDPTAFEVADIYETSVCPLARVMRRELRQRGIKSLKVVYSKEKPIVPKCQPLDSFSGDSLSGDVSVDTRGEDFALRRESVSRRSTPGSSAFVPPVVGLIIAGVVVKDLAGIGKE